MTDNRPWPIDKYVSAEEFKKFPTVVKQSLFESAQYANGHTYIKQMDSKTFETQDDAVRFVLNFADDEGFMVARDTYDDGQLKGFRCVHDVIYGQTRKRSYDEALRSDDFKSKPETGAGADASSNNAPKPSDTPAETEDYRPCPFKVEITGSRLEVICSEHNHGPVGPAASAKRRRLTCFQKSIHDDFVVPAFIKPISIASPGGIASLHSASGSALSTAAPMSAGVLGGVAGSHEKTRYDQLKGLVGALTFDNALIEDVVDDEGRVSNLFWTTQDCVDMLQQYPEVLFIDFIKSSGGSPILVHIVGITGLNTTFEVGYAFISEVSLAEFSWVLYSLKDVVSKYLQKPYEPSAVITHREPMLLNAVDTVFQNTSQICVAQLMREVNDRASAAFSDVDERKQFIKVFQELVDSETPDIYAYNETDFRRKYGKTKMLEYVTYHWLVYKTKFVRAWADQHRHFNNYSMGKAELAQTTVRAYMDDAKGDLLKFYYKINELLARKKRAHEELVENELVKCPVKFYVPFYDDVRFKISTFALELIKEQHELYLEARTLHRCTGMFTTTTGLPCKHTLSRPVTMSDCHTHWWLSKNRPFNALLSHSDLISNDLTSKFDRTFQLARQHFLSLATPDAKERLLSSVSQYFHKLGVPNVALPRRSSTSSQLSSRENTPPPLHHNLPSSFLPTSISYIVHSEGDSDTSGAEDGKIKIRRCGRCNQIGHNSRTCTHRSVIDR